MATNFKIGDKVKLTVFVPQGEITQLTITQEGVIQYLFSWNDANGVSHSRWFNENELEPV
jgi:uncharacterized protein YodC (DUF2158 family)